MVHNGPLFRKFYLKILQPPSQDGSNGDSLPIGTIIAYNGPLSAIPVGWHLCDGTDGTPDLRGRFLEGSDVAGVFLEPALPNIKDWSNNRVMLLMYNNPSAKGVITFRKRWRIRRSSHR